MSTRVAERDSLTPTDECAAVALIDAALSAWAQRGSFTRDEALAILADVQHSVEATVLGAPVISIINDAVLSYDGDLLLDRWRLLDPLLDIRRILSP